MPTGGIHSTTRPDDLARDANEERDESTEFRSQHFVLLAVSYRPSTAGGVGQTLARPCGSMPRGHRHVGPVLTRLSTRAQSPRTPDPSCATKFSSLQRSFARKNNFSRILVQSL